MNRNEETAEKIPLYWRSELPVINDTGGFIVLEQTRGMLAQLWGEFIQITMYTLEHYSNAAYTKDITEYREGKKRLSSLDHKLRAQFGMVEEIPIADVTGFDDGGMLVEMKMGIGEMIEIYYSDPKVWTSEGYNARAVIDRFFGYLWVRELLLYPLKHPEGYQRPAMWKSILAVSIILLGKDHPLIRILEERFRPMEGAVSNTRTYRLNAVSNLMVATTWRSPDDVTEEGLRKAEELISEHLAGGGKRIRFARLVINEIRYALTELGRGDIIPPNRGEKERRRRDKPFPNLMDVGPNTGENIMEIMSKGESFLAALKNDGLAKGTITGYASSLNAFFRYLIERYPDRKVTRDLVAEIYDPHNGSCLLEHLREKGMTDQGIARIISQVSSFLTHCELMTPRAMKNIPRVGGKTRRHGARRAMPQEMVSHLYDIIRNRPPNNPTIWFRKKADASWWEHDVWPVLPILFLLLYTIPLRGGQARHLCRKRSFVLDEKGERLKKLVINTDKNVNRKYLQEIPCAWEELQIFVPFLKWHREYFPHLPEVTYNDDENTPWEKIEPVMILPDSPVPLSKRTMMDYHKRLLCRYQLEKMREAEERGKPDDYPLVAWSKSGRPFFESFEELDVASTYRISDIAVLYDIHSLRVTGATRYLEAGLGIPHLMMLTGHATPGVLLNIYIDLKEEERKRALESAIAKISFLDRKDAVESGRTFIREEMVGAFEEGKESMLEAIEKNDLFSPERRSASAAVQRELQRGTEIALETHPSNWQPMIHGICPGTKCPDGRENRCSLCPYFITGRLFLDGLVFMENRALARFERERVQAAEEREKGYASPARAEEMEITLEEAIGYHDILERILEDMKPEDGQGKEDGANLPAETGTGRVVAEEIPETLAYLRDAYEAGLYGVEKDRYGMKVLVIRAMKIAAELGDSRSIPALADEPERAVDYLMDFYRRNPEEIGLRSRTFFTKLLGRGGKRET